MSEPIVTLQAVIADAELARSQGRTADNCPYPPFSDAGAVWERVLREKPVPKPAKPRKSLARGHFNVRKGGQQ